MSPKDDNSHTMIDTFPDPIAHHRVIVDESGNPADYVYIYVNFAFEVMTGLNRDDIIGQKVTGILPTFKDSVFDWISIYDKLTTINKTTLFEHFSERTGQWCEITTCSDEPGSFAVLFRNINHAEQYKSRQALKESEEKYRSLIEQSADMIYLHKVNGNIVDVNDAAILKTGYSKEELLRMSVFDLHPDKSDRADILNRWKRWEGGGEPVIIDHYHMCKDGTVFPIEVSTRKVIFGGKEYILALVRDISKRKQAEETLEKERKKFKTLFENSSNAIIIHDKDSGAILDVNSKALDLYGFSKIEDLNNNDFWHDPPYSFKEALGWIHKAAKEGPQLFQWLNRKKSGELFWEEVQLNKIIIDGVEQILSTSVDITERKEAQENLSKNKEFYELLLGSTHDPLHVVDSNLIIVFANKKFNNDLKLYANNISIPGNPLNKVCPFLPDHAFEEYRTVFNNGKPLFTEESTEIEGITFYTETTKSPVFDLDGKVSHVITVVRNISERKEAEEALKKSEDELAKAYRQLNEEINKAAAIHNRILPDEIPETQAISIAAHYQPATRMGGDSYNVIKSGNKLIVYLSDVMGHGLDGALISVFVKEAISSYITLKPEELNPQKILQHLSSQYYCENYPDEQLICIFLGVIDLATMNLSYAGAGFQTEPLIKLGNGKKEKLNCGGIFISNAVPPEILKFEERNITLTPGTTILITTDGLAEQESGEDLFYRRYEDIFYEKSHLPPKVIVQAINRDFCMFNGNSLTGNDDISYLVLQHNLSDKEKHHLEIKSSFEGLESLYNQIKTLTANYPENYNLTTCLHELICNAIEHGNKLDPDKKVTIDLEITQQYIFIEVEDQGEGFNWCEKIGKQFDLEGGSERGRGIPLLRILSANVYYNQKGNRASLLIETN